MSKTIRELGGLDMFWVFKKDDAQELSDPDKVLLSECLAKIALIRALNGKEMFNNYIVINTDEPYIDEIIAVMKAHGQWG
jgi:hypothetical protein